MSKKLTVQKLENLPSTMQHSRLTSQHYATQPEDHWVKQLLYCFILKHIIIAFTLLPFSFSLQACRF